MKYLPVLVVVALSGCSGDATDVSVKNSDRRARSLAIEPTSATQVKVPGYRFEYAVARASDGAVILTRLGDGSAVAYPPSTLSFAFEDRLVSLDETGIVGQAYRLYQAAFNRQPDQSGLGFWISALSSSMSLEQVAAQFVDSQEFRATYGNVEDRQFIELVYQNVLHRSPDGAGFDYWLNSMRSGLTRPGLLSFFSESAENKANVASETRLGMSYYVYPTSPAGASPSMFQFSQQVTQAAPNAAAALASAQLALPSKPLQTGYPEADSENQMIVIAALSTPTGTFGPIGMRILADGVLAPVGTPRATSQQPVASYDPVSGVLRMDLLSIGAKLYADARWRLEQNGTFRLVTVRPPVFADFVELLPDVFVGGRVDSHYSLVTSIQQMQSGKQGDLLMLGNTYWDFSRTGLDRYRQGPQQLLKWDGSRFHDVSTTLVDGGIPAMYQVESEKMLADFNGDGRPDVILGGNGPDGDGNTGEPSYALLSSGAQGYTISKVPDNAEMPGRLSWVHGGAALKLRDKTSPVAFIGDFAFGPSYLVEFAPDGSANKLAGRLPAYVGQSSSAMDYYFKSADFPVTAALGVDLDNDGADELVLGGLYSYSAALVAPQLNALQTMVLTQDASGSFASAKPIALPDGPFAKRDCYQKPDCESLTVKQIATADFNRDGLSDLLVTHHRYGAVYASATQLLINKGKLQFEDATAKWFGGDMQHVGQWHIHSYPYDLNGDGCPDVVLRGDQINSARPKVFIGNCNGRMSDFSSQFTGLMPPGSQYMHGGVPVSLGGKPAVLVFNMMGSAARFSAVRFKYPIPTPSE